MSASSLSAATCNFVSAGAGSAGATHVLERGSLGLGVVNDRGHRGQREDARVERGEDRVHCAHPSAQPAAAQRRHLLVRTVGEKREMSERAFSVEFSRESDASRGGLSISWASQRSHSRSTRPWQRNSFGKRSSRRPQGSLVDAGPTDSPASRVPVRATNSTNSPKSQFPLFFNYLTENISAPPLIRAMKLLTVIESNTRTLLITLRFRILRASSFNCGLNYVRCPSRGSRTTGARRRTRKTDSPFCTPANPSPVTTHCCSPREP